MMLPLLTMSLMAIIITLVVVGIVVYVVNTYIPMDGTIKKILNIVVVIAVIIWLLKELGAWEYLERVRP